MDKLSQSQEDYLEAIYNQIVQKNCAKVTDIAAVLNVKKSSVSGALSSLCEKGLINYSPYSSISLTEKGEMTAKKIFLRHEVMTNFLINILNMDTNEAAENACRLEHVMSEKMFERIHSFSHFLQDYASKNSEFRESLKSLFKK